MKKLFKKLALMVVALLSFSVGSNYTVKEVKAADISATLTFDNTSKRTVGTKTQQKWEENGIIFINNKSSSTSDVNTTYYKPVRLYANSEIIVECTLGNITKIVFDANSPSYATTLKNSIGSAATASSDKVTVTLDGSSKLYTVAKLTAQVRMDSLTVTYSEESSEGDKVEPTIKISGNSFIDLGNTLQLEPQTTNFDGTVIWTSSDVTVATVDNGMVKPISMGKTTITATAGSAEAFMDIIVYPANNSKLTISEAIEVCELVGNAKTPYKYSVSGKVTNLSYSSQHDSYTADIVNGNEKIKAFGMKKSTKLIDGVLITVTGNLKNYDNKTPEFDSGCTYVIDQVDNLLNVALTDTSFSLAFNYKLVPNEDYVEPVSVASSEESTATLSFADEKYRTEIDGDHQVWEQNGVKVTNNQGSSTSAVANYVNPVRFYKSSQLNVEYSGKIISKIIFECSEEKYATALQNSITSGNVTIDSLIVTVVFNELVESFSCTLTGGQVRMNSITVTAGGGESSDTEKVEKYSSEVYSNVAILFGATVDASLFEGYTVTAGGVLIDNAANYDENNTLAKAYEACEFDADNFDGIVTEKTSLTPVDGNYTVGSVIEVISGEVIKEGDNANIDYLKYEFIAAAYFVLEKDETTTTVVLDQKSYSVKEMLAYYSENANDLGLSEEQNEAVSAFKDYIG